MTTFVEMKATREAISVLNSDTGETFDFAVIGDAHGDFSLAPMRSGEDRDANGPDHGEDLKKAQAFAESVLAKLAP